MQPQIRQSKKDNGKGRVVLSLLLAVALGVGGYFVTTMVLTGQSPIKSAEDNHVPQSDVPTDANGDNIIGNSMQNLQAGGLMAMQGEDIFYVNFADGGSLYCRSRNGEITKLTDFAVANLNVRGEVLGFTDLNACSVIGEEGSIVTLSAATHEELWDQMDENDQIRYGGHLYFISGVKSLCTGEIAYDDLTIAGVESEERYQAPVFLENGDILLIAASQGDGMMPVSSTLDPTPAATLELAPAFMQLSATVNAPSVLPVQAAAVAYTPDSVMIVKPGEAMLRVNLGSSQGDLIQNAVAAGDKIFVETANIINGSRMGTTITAIDASTGKAVGTISGDSLQSDGENLFFINENTIFKFHVQTGKMTQVSETPCDSSWYEIRPDGTVVYESRDTRTNANMATMRAEPEKNGTYTTKVGGDGRIPFFIRKNVTRLAGNSYYAWNNKLGAWTRVDTEIISKAISDDDKESAQNKGKTRLYDYSNIVMGWSREKRDIGQNGLHWLQPDELGSLFTVGDKPADTPAPTQNPSTPTPAPATPTPAQATPTPDPAPATPEAKDLVGTWNGTYQANQGESGMSLDVYEDSGKVFARWYFYSLPGKSNTKSGSVLMEVGYDSVSGMYKLTTIAEDDQPQGYGTMSLAGTLTGDTFSGNSDCAFSVKKGALAIP